MNSKFKTWRYVSTSSRLKKFRCLRLKRKCNKRLLKKIQNLMSLNFITCKNRLKKSFRLQRKEFQFIRKRKKKLTRILSLLWRKLNSWRCRVLVWMILLSRGEKSVIWCLGRIRTRPARDLIMKISKSSKKYNTIENFTIWLKGRPKK